MEDDLGSLQMFFANANDYVLVNKQPGSNFLKSFKPLEIKIPHYILKNKFHTDPDFLQLKKNKLLPWGWSPAAHKFLEPLKPNCSEEFLKSPVSGWKPEHRDLYSKKNALETLTKILTNFPDEHFMPAWQKPVSCTTKNDFETQIRKWGEIMVKAPWSSSGRGLQPVKNDIIHPKVWEKLLGIVKEQGYAIVEPFHKKALDLAFLFELKNKKVNFVGTSIFFTDKKGRYLGNYLNGLPKTANKTVVDFQKNIQETIISSLILVIEKSKLATFYEGFFGVDTLIYFTKNNKLKINPCLEINVRQSMGLLSLHLEKLILPGKKGVFRIFYQPGVSFPQFKNEMVKKHPLQISGNKIESGFLTLTEATQNTLFGAYILV